MASVKGVGKRLHESPASSAKKARLEEEASLLSSSLSPEDDSEDVSLTSSQFNELVQKAQAGKPHPIGQPLVWAINRQQLCEVLQWYKAYQSGGYSHNNILLGQLIDSGVSPGDIVTEQVVITRIGGCRGKNAKGELVQKAHQNEKSPQVRAALNSQQMHQPVGVIAGQANPLLPCKMPHRYNVLDYFFVTDVWCERIDGFRTYKIRLEKCDLATVSWWAASMAYTTQNIGPEELATQKCPTCQKSSPIIYINGWTCLEPKCHDHFRFYDDTSKTLIQLDQRLLEHNNAFIRKRMPQNATQLPSLYPPDLIIDNKLKYNQGILCPDCRCCIRRTEMHAWRCENKSCNYVRDIPYTIVSLDEIQPTRRLATICKDEIQHRNITLGSYTVQIYTFPGETKENGEPGDAVGEFYHFKGGNLANIAALFEMMQGNELGMARKPARLEGCAGEMLTAHAAINFGAPYKYGVTQESKSFKEAPEAVLQAVNILTWAGEKAHVDGPEEFRKEPYLDFNECLSIGYLPGGSIGWHDDGEKELSGTVASLSLGCAATMSFRPKKTANIGPPSRNQKYTKPTILSVILEHGDIMVMRGSKVQKFYEHQVVPHGSLRFVLTCRHVLSEMVKPEERAKSITDGFVPLEHRFYALKKLAVADFPSLDKAEELLQEISGAGWTYDYLVGVLKRAGLDEESHSHVLGWLGSAIKL
ncbi:hypothetical protein B0O99DRAFT_693224 [Bisporella sp. PMI_857]|nr:hypothetical protein B0O99DRAFT_693224 [Bisporella sp. PMI_857]